MQEPGTGGGVRVCGGGCCWRPGGTAAGRTGLSGGGHCPSGSRGADVEHGEAGQVGATARRSAGRASQPMRDANAVPQRLIDRAVRPLDVRGRNLLIPRCRGRCPSGPWWSITFISSRICGDVTPHARRPCYGDVGASRTAASSSTLRRTRPQQPIGRIAPHENPIRMRRPPHACALSGFRPGSRPKQERSLRTGRVPPSDRVRRGMRQETRQHQTAPHGRSSTNVVAAGNRRIAFPQVRGPPPVRPKGFEPQPSDP